MYSKQDLAYASEFRNDIHKEALAIVRKTRPDITEVVDRHPMEDYFQEHWDYPGMWYTIVAIPSGYGSRKAFVDALVRDTLTGSAPPNNATPKEQGRRKLTNQLDGKPSGYRELFVVEVDQETRSFRAVGIDDKGRHILEHYEEYSLGSATGSTGTYFVLSDAEFRRYARLALVNGQIAQEQYDGLVPPDADAVYALIAEYPDCVVDYCVVKPDAPYSGYASHRAALKTAWQTHFAADEDGETWQGNPTLATGKPITVDEFLSSDYRDGELNYRKAFLYPPHENGYTGMDFVRVNNALFPNGTDALEVYRWSTDWSEYFDEGREWWGTLCISVYDKTMDRFVIIMASATD